MRIEFHIPGAPQGKGRAKIVNIGGFSRMATPGKTMAYEGMIAHIAQQAMKGRPLIAGPVSVLLRINCQIPASWSDSKRARALAGAIMPTTKPDCDNVTKACYDACNGVVWRDDSQVCDGTQIKRYADVPGVAVEILALQPQQMPIEPKVEAECF